MKTMIISDVHQDEVNLLKALKIFNDEKYERLIILGDLEANSKIGEILADYREKITIIRGNCDLPLNDKYLNVKPVTMYYQKINNYNCYFYHGHHGMPNLEFYDQTICFSGHTHIGLITHYFSVIMANPGSISRPRNHLKTYLEFNNNSLILYSLDNKTKIKEITL